jgi:hypothetical protein
MFKDPNINRKVDIFDNTVYFPIGGEYRKNTIEGEKNIKEWNSYLGRKVIVFSRGYSPINDTYIRMPFVQHSLVTGYHPLDKFPTLISEVSNVESIAKSLGYVKIELTPSIYKKRKKNDPHF